MFGLFKKRKKTVAPEPQTNAAPLPAAAVVFIDYDHWNVSLNANYRVKTDIQYLLDSISKQYEIKEIFVFGDFISAPEAYGKFTRLTENIYDVRNGQKNEKDIILLDKIYNYGHKHTGERQTAILITGNGGYALAARFLRDECCLETGVYGIRGSMSEKLKAAADWARELPNEDTIDILFPLVIQNFVYIQKSNRDIVPTFLRTVQAVASYNLVDEYLIEFAVKKMLDMGYLYQRETRVGFNDKVRVLYVKWDLLIRDGWYDPDAD